jgi:hypothetical protein
MDDSIPEFLQRNGLPPRHRQTANRMALTRSLSSAPISRRTRQPKPKLGSPPGRLRDYPAARPRYGGAFLRLYPWQPKLIGPKRWTLYRSLYKSGPLVVRRPGLLNSRWTTYAGARADDGALTGFPWVSHDGR